MISDEFLETYASLTYSDKAKFLINEVMSVCNKRKLSIDFFPVELVNTLLAARKMGALKNTKIREIMNEYTDRKLAG